MQLLRAVVCTCILVKCPEILRLENIFGTGNTTSLWDAIVVFSREGAREGRAGEEGLVDLEEDAVGPEGSLLFFFFPVKADFMMEVSICGE